MAFSLGVWLGLGLWLELNYGVLLAMLGVHEGLGEAPDRTTVSASGSVHMLSLPIARPDIECERSRIPATGSPGAKVELEGHLGCLPGWSVRPDDTTPRLASQKPTHWTSAAGPESVRGDADAACRPVDARRSTSLKLDLLPQWHPSEIDRDCTIGERLRDSWGRRLSAQPGAAWTGPLPACTAVSAAAAAAAAAGLGLGLQGGDGLGLQGGDGLGLQERRRGAGRATGLGEQLGLGDGLGLRRSELGLGGVAGLAR